MVVIQHELDIFRRADRSVGRQSVGSHGLDLQKRGPRISGPPAIEQRLLDQFDRRQTLLAGILQCIAQPVGIVIAALRAQQAGAQIADKVSRGVHGIADQRQMQTADFPVDPAFDRSEESLQAGQDRCRIVQIGE